MKKLLTLLLFVFACCFVDAQNISPKLTTADTLYLQYLDIFREQLMEPRYKLYPTQNNWTFLKLDTMTGQIWQVQYSIDSNPRMEYTLDDSERIYSWDEHICGRFELYETKNIYNFILLDKIEGRCWQVQWNFDINKRFVIPIY